MENLLYMCTASRTLQDSLEAFHTCSIVLDEARFTNAEVLQVFAAGLLDVGSSAGVLLPPQLLPELHVDVTGVKVAVRIAEACKRQAQAKAPKGDALLATWEKCIGVHNALRNVFAKGLEEFRPKARPACISETVRGQYVVDIGNARVLLPTRVLDNRGCNGRLRVKLDSPDSDAEDEFGVIAEGEQVFMVVCIRFSFSLFHMFVFMVCSHHVASPTLVRGG